MKNFETVDLYAKAVVARYLDENGHKDTLTSFLADCSLSMSDVKNTRATFNDSLETLVSERIAFADRNSNVLRKLSLNGESLPIAAETPTWNHGAKFEPADIKVDKKTLAIAAKFCGVEQSLLLSFADRRVCLYSSELKLKDTNLLENNMGVVTLFGKILESNKYYMCRLGGILEFQPPWDSKFIPFQLHLRMITHLQFMECLYSDQWYVVSCGMDNILKVHELTYNRDSLEPIASIQLLSACTSLQVAYEGERKLIFVTRADHTHLFCYEIIHKELLLLYKVALNEAQFSTYSFNVRDTAFIGDRTMFGTPLVTKSSMLLVATSHTPYMRLLVADITAESINDKDTVLYGKILKNMATEVEQDSYSEPFLRVLPEDNGVLVGDSKGLYAIDILNGDSWLLDLPGIAKGSRVKCMDVNRAGTKLVLGLADKTVHAYNIT